MTKRATSVTIGSTRYPRFGYGRCQSCGLVRVLFYKTPDQAGVAVCAACLEASTTREEQG